MKELSARLKLIASLVPQGSSVCDVGTDHGFLPAALYLGGKQTKVTATDINEKPLLSAKKNLQKLKADKVNLVLCDGLSEVTYKDAETVIIAGMGGDVISGIIERCSFKEKPLFILQPMTASFVLRRYLAENGFFVSDEKAIKENGKIYSVMTAKFDGKPYSLSPLREKIGLITAICDDNILYLKKQLSIANKSINDLKGIKEKEEMYLNALSVKQGIEKLLEEKNGD